MVLILFSEPVYRNLTTGRPKDHSKDDRELDSLLATLTFEPDSMPAVKNYLKQKPIPPIPFYSFDPNTIEKDKLTKLGLSSFLTSRIIRYREKGGKFKKKEDLQKIYGMDSAWYNKASAWISIPKTENISFPSRATDKKVTIPETFNINISDSTQLIKVYGIGPALSKRISTFRDRLGGFISMNQLKEVYGLDTSTVKALEKKFFVADNFVPQKININTLKAEEVRHPYIKRKELQAIIAYRMQHGNFQSLNELSNIKILSQEFIEKVKPYLSL